MLIDFKVSNWKSYSEEASLNLVASLERRDRDTLSLAPGFRSLKILPTTAVYGGNASGKTSLFQALAFLQQMVTVGVGVGDPIPVTPFRLDAARARDESTIELTFIAGKTVYQMLLSVDRDGVKSESLWIMRDRHEPALAYSREMDSYEFGEGAFAEPERVSFVAGGTRENQLFLNAAAQQNVSELAEAYRWFKETLVLVGVSSQNNSLGLYYTRPNFLEFASSTLSELDTGIEDISGDEVDVDSLPIPGKALSDLSSTVGGPDVGRSMILRVEPSGDYPNDLYFIDRDEDGLRARRLVTRHRNSEGKLVPFPLSLESSGSRRLVELMPMLFDLLGGFEGSEKVYVVDELDRCLHSMLTSKLVEGFLRTCGPKSRRQLLFTTQDLLLMDQSVLRRDEMFVAERDARGRSSLVRLDEYEGLRADLDLLKSYLEGRFGGVPMFRGDIGGGHR